MNSEYQNKKILIQSVPIILRNHRADYNIYFITITFENVHKKQENAAYEATAKMVYQKVNQYSMNNPSRHCKKKAKMILLPENSHKCKVENMQKARHYHGFLLIHKDNCERFNRKCINGLSLKKEISHQEKMILKIHTTNLQKLSSNSDIINTTKYCAKDFFTVSNINPNIDYDDVMYFCNDSKGTK